MTFEKWYDNTVDKDDDSMVLFFELMRNELEQAYKAGFQEGMLNGTMKDYEV